MALDDKFKGSLYQGSEEPSLLNRVGRAVAGFGAGYQGKGMEYLASLDAQREKEQNELMLASISDAQEIKKLIGGKQNTPWTEGMYDNPLMSSLQTYNKEGIKESVDILNDRISLLRGRNQDDSDTFKIRDRILRGDISGANTEIDNFLRQAQSAGYIAKPEFLEVTKNGQILTRDPNTGEITTENIEGYDAMGLGNMPSNYLGLLARAAAAGLEEGTDEFKNFMRLGGRDASSSGITKFTNGTTIQTTGDGRKIISVPGIGVLPDETEADRAAIEDAVDLGRKSGVEIAGLESYAGAVGSGRGERINTQIDDGLRIADTLPILNRTMGLLKEIETGGINRVKIQAKSLFGVESAEEGLLSANLGKAVLSQLKDTFGAQFTEREGARLDRISARLGSSNESNIAQIQQAIEIATSAAYRGINAAEEAGDEFTAQQIRDAMRFNLGDDELGAYFGVSQNTIAAPTVIPDGDEGQIIYDELPSGASYVLPDNTVMKKP